MDILEIDLIHKECSKYYEDYKLMGSYNFFLPFFRVIMKMTYVSENKLNVIEQYICKCINRGIVKKDQICDVLALDDYIFKCTLSDLESKNYLKVCEDEVLFTELGEDLYKREVKLDEKVINLTWYYDGLYPEFNNDFFNNEDNHTFFNYRDIEIKKDAISITPKTIPNYNQERDYNDLSYAAIKKFNENQEEEKIVNVSSFQMMKERKLLYHEYIIMIYKNAENKFKLLAYDICGNKGIDQRITKNLQRLYEEGKLTEVMYSSNSKALSDMIFAIENYNTQSTFDYTEDVKEVIENNSSDTVDNYDFNEEYLMNYEIREKFLYFLKNAKESLYIISPWMNNYIVNNEFIADIENLLKSGVKIRIKYGISSIDEIDKDIRNRKTSNLATNLKELGKNYGDLLEIEHGQTHEKLCICDRKYYINGSFNFLSYSGKSGDGFRNEGSTYTENKLLINQVIKKRFGE